MVEWGQKGGIFAPRTGRQRAPADLWSGAGGWAALECPLPTGCAVCRRALHVSLKSYYTALAHLIGRRRRGSVSGLALWAQPLHCPHYHRCCWQRQPEQMHFSRPAPGKRLVQGNSLLTTTAPNGPKTEND